MAEKKPKVPMTAGQMIGGLAVWVVLGFGVYACVNSGPKAGEPTIEQREANIFNKVIKPAGGKAVAIWRDYDAMEKGTTLIAAGQASRHWDLVEPLISCAAHAGDSVTVTESHVFTVQVLVTSGTADGCEGWMARESLMDAPTPKQ